VTAPSDKPPTSPCKGEVDREAGGRGSALRFSRTAGMTSKARQLRQIPTEAEKALWKALRRNQLCGVSFRRQHPIGRYVLDFYCASAGLAIEVDGGQHAEGSQREIDRRRDQWLSANGIRMLRFWNNEVLSNLQGVLQTIVMELEKTPSRREERADLPLPGGGYRTETP
jgi:very-short-patch-repair endonuclease